VAATDFRSVLFAAGEPPGAGVAPDTVTDLHLDQIVAAVTSGREEYDLGAWFLRPLRSAAAVEYRHAVVRDLRRDDVREPVVRFAQRMHRVRAHLQQAETLRARLQRQRWFLEAVDAYCSAVSALENRLAGVELGSDALHGLREHLSVHVASASFRRLAADCGELQRQLATVRYGMQIRGPRVTVQAYGGEPDYGVEVEKTFARFQQGAVEDHAVRFTDDVEMNHVESQVLDRVALLYPRLFGELAGFCARHRDFRDPVVVRFDREVQFYLAYLGFTERIGGKGLTFSLPEVSDGRADLVVEDGFDLALAAARRDGPTPVVCNSISLRGPERIAVVTGPNQGGKTTFARMLGQVAHLARLGLPVPARRLTLGLPDRVMTVFEREEDPGSLHGKLDDELVRIRDVLAAATDRSVVVLNESFASTTLHDARFIGREVLRRLGERGSVAVYVTFVDELASLGEHVVSMVATVGDEPGERTYRVVRRPADGLAYAAVLAARFGLTYEALQGRITR
jgi:DNA mismatch repair protein MutS